MKTRAAIEARPRWLVVTTLPVDCKRHWSRVFIVSADGSGNTFGVRPVWRKFGTVDVAKHNSPLVVAFEPCLVAMGIGRLRILKLRKCDCCFYLQQMVWLNFAQPNPSKDLPEKSGYSCKCLYMYFQRSDPQRGSQSACFWKYHASNYHEYNRD